VDHPLGRAEGDILWPEWFKREMFPTDPRVASALYQCRPSPEEGDYFRRDWILEYHSMAELPGTLRRYAASDHACKENQQNDRTVLGVFGVDDRGDIWLLPDTVFRRMDTGEMVEEMLALNKVHRPISWWAESEMILKSVGPFLDERMRRERCFIPIEEMHSTKDLVSRAQSIKGRMRARTVHFPAFATWYHEALHEMLSFPVGTHDDFVAMLAEIGQGLDKLTYARVKKIEPKFDQHACSFNLTIEYLRKADEYKRRQEQVAIADW